MTDPDPNPTIAFIGYDSSGRITVVGGCQLADLAHQSMPGVTYLQAAGTETQDDHYVTGGVIAARPACPISASLAARVVTLTGVPIGTLWIVSGANGLTSGTTDAATMTFTFTGPGTFKLFVDCFPAQDFNQEFTVT